MDPFDWPPLSLSDWEPTYVTLHRWSQIVGKIRMAHAAPLNHWWHVPLYVSAEGLTTSALPCGRELVTLTFDFREHRLVATSSDDRTEGFALEPMTVAAFYERTMDLMRRFGAETQIWPVPVEVTDKTPFPADRHHAAYDPAAVERLHRILINVHKIFSEYRGQFVGKGSPVHLFWGAFDLAVTRFSGRKNPTPPQDPVMGPAYSHEVISHGFWPGGDWPAAGRVEEAVFYAYAVPEPAGFRDDQPPSGGSYDPKLGEFVLRYDDVRRAADPAALLRTFMDSTYAAAARRAGWPPELVATR